MSFFARTPLCLVIIIAICTFHPSHTHTAIEDRGDAKSVSSTEAHRNDNQGASASPPSCCVNPKTLANPLLNTLLFPPNVCPLKTPDVICKAAAERLGLPHTSLYARGGGDLDGAEGGVLLESSADVAIVGVGGCYNVYASVGRGTVLSTNCSNELVEFQDLVGTSVLAGGSYEGQTRVVTGVVIVKGSALVAGDWLSTRAATIGGSLIQPPASLYNYELAIGGRIALSSKRIVLQPPPLSIEITTALVSMPTDRLPFYEVGEIDRSYVPYVVCEISQQSRNLTPNGDAEIIVARGHDPRLILTCTTEVDEVCVIHVPSFTVPSYETLYMDVYNPNGSPLIVNFAGEAILWNSVVQSGSAGRRAVMLNFFEAKVVRISSLVLFAGGVVCPLATEVTIDVPAPQFVWVGPTDSKLTTAVDVAMDFNTYFLLKPRKQLVMCDCLCEGEEKRAKGGEVNEKTHRPPHS